MSARSALVYGDVNLNLIDGSAIWVQSMVLALARAGCTVTLVLKAPVQTDRLLTPLEAEPGVTVRVDVYIEMAHGSDAFFRALPTTRAERIGSYIDVCATGILLGQPSEVTRRECNFHSDDPLRDLICCITAQ